MQPFPRPSLLASASAVLLALSACGGGDSGGRDPAPSATAQSLSGTVAVGAPMLDAVVTVMDAHGVTRTAQAQADGSYAGLDVAGLTAPFRVQACGLVDGTRTCYYSVATAAGRANVTPLTHATVSLALNDDAAALFSGSAAPDAAALAAKKQAIRTALGPVLTAAGLASDIDFTTVAFSADRTGLDKVLDAVKVSTGHDGGHAFVQMEGRIGAGNVYLDGTGVSTGGLDASVASNLSSVSLTGITAIFSAMSTAIGQSTVQACTTSMSSAGIFDGAFTLDIGGGAVNATAAPGLICAFAGSEGLLGGKVANPVLRDCDFSGADKTCQVGFTMVKDGAAFDGAELAVVRRSAGSGWQLLGEASPYKIHVNASVQRTLRVGVQNPTAEYSRAISFDIATAAGGVTQAVRAAKVYQRNAAGTGWETSPMVELSDSACSGERLTIAGSSCGGTWMSLDDYGGAGLAAGDALIDAFYKRGRQVRIVLFSDTAGTVQVAEVVKRVEGVPPKSDALASFPWLELDSATASLLASFDSASAPSDDVAVHWLPNGQVSAHDVSLCEDRSCGTRVREEINSLQAAAGSRTLDVGSLSLSASGYKLLALYGRNHDQLGVSTTYISCTTGTTDCPAP